MQQHGATAVVKEEPRWHAALAVLAALGLYVTLPPRLVIGPLWLFPVLVLIIMVPLNIFSPTRHAESPWHRGLSIATVALVNLFNAGTIVALLYDLISTHAHRQINGQVLILAAVQIWFTNVIVYALWFWEIDGAGPDPRAHRPADAGPAGMDFLFPQMALSAEIRKELQWRPRVLDYLFLSFTNATAFSPTDTFPLTGAAKLLMMAEALTSLVTIAIIAGRAINILGG